MKVLDDRFAAPAYLLLPVLGLAMVFVGGWDLGTPWIVTGLALYGVIVVVGVGLYSPTLRSQIAAVKRVGRTRTRSAGSSPRGPTALARCSGCSRSGSLPIWFSSRVVGVDGQPRHSSGVRGGVSGSWPRQATGRPASGETEGDGRPTGQSPHAVEDRAPEIQLGIVDLAMAWVDRLAGPPWMAYPVGTLIIALALNAVAWADGLQPPGSFDLYRSSLAVYPMFALALMHHLNAMARRALTAFRPIARLDGC